jgi:anti-sigma-K factor RskA
VIGGTAAGVAIWQNHHQRGQVTVEEQITAVISAPDVKLHKADVKGGGKINLLTSAERGEGVVVGQKLAPIPSTNDYQVWAVNAEGEPRSLGLLPRSPATPRLLLAGIVTGDTIAITEEPAGGSPQPTTDILVKVTLK